MKHFRYAASVGAFLSIYYFIDTLTKMGFSNYLGTKNEMLLEILMNFGLMLLMIAPAIVLTRFKDIQPGKYPWLIYSYPLLLLLGLLNYLLANDALAAGLPYVVVVLPFCFVFTIALLLMRKKKT